MGGKATIILFVSNTFDKGARMKEHYIFDFDGTLIDSMPIHEAKILHLFHLSGIEPPPNLINVLTPLGDKGAIPYLRQHFPVRHTDEQIYEALDSYALSHYENDIPLKDGVLEYLTYLKKKNKSLYILTASPHRLIDPCIKRLGLEELFEQAWSCEEFSTVKSDPTLFKRVAEQIGCSLSNIVFFDDNRTAVETAKSVGITTVGVYDRSSEKDKPTIAAVADWYVTSLSELIGQDI